MRGWFWYVTAMRKPVMLLGLVFAAPACGTEEPAGPTAPQLGSGDHSPSSVTFTPIATAANGLKQPRDLAFNPLRPEEMWIVNYDDDSVVIVTGAPNDGRTYEKRI